MNVRGWREATGTPAGFGAALSSIIPTRQNAIVLFERRRNAGGSIGWEGTALLRLR